MKGSRSEHSMVERSTRRSAKTGPSARPPAPRMPGGVRILHRKPGEPLYQQLFDILLEQVTAGQYGPGDPLPTEEWLSESFGVSRSTARQAMGALETQGLVVRRQGIGTFVEAPPKPAQMHVPMSGIEKYAEDVHRNMKLRLVELKYCTAPPHVQKVFNCEPEEVFQRTQRVRSADDVPILYIVTYIRESIAVRFSEEQIRSQSFLELLELEGFRHESGRQTISAVLADADLAFGLQVKVGDPLLQVRRVNIDKRWGPIEYMEFYSSPTRFELDMVLDPPGVA